MAFNALRGRELLTNSNPNVSDLAKVRTNHVGGLDFEQKFGRGGEQ